MTAGMGEHQPSAAGLIEIKLTSVAQLFNSFDPSPFQDKDLDDDAEEYIVGTARELAGTAPFTLMLYLPFEAAATADVAALQESIRNFFAYRVGVLSRQLRETLRLGRTSLLVGLAFLFACMALRGLLERYAGQRTLAVGLGEGLLIAGWVALWGPIQILLYDWWPIVRRRRILKRLSGLHVVVRAV